MAGLLDGRVAIVTGAGGGIGRSVAEQLGAMGASVVVNDIGGAVDGSGASGGPAEDVATAIRESGGQAVANLESVVNMSGGENLVQCALDNYGKLDIVVTAAGILRDRMIFNMSEEEWDDVIAVHLKGTFTIVKHASILMRQQRSGRIVTFSSESGMIGFAGQANYGAAKSGIGGFTKVVARDLGKYGVTANCIVPRADTRMVATIPDSVKQQMAESGFDMGDPNASRAPADVAPMAGFLASDYAATVNGQVFLVHGGTIGLMSQPRIYRSIFNPGGGFSVPGVDKMASRHLLKGPGEFAPDAPNAGTLSEGDDSLDGKVAIVTGGGRGIGASVAKTLAAQGAKVVVNDIGADLDGSGGDIGPAAQVVADIKESGGEAVVSYDSVTEYETGENLVQTALDEFGRLDIVVTPAGILRDRMIFNMSEEEWDAVIDVHLKGTFNVVRHASVLFRQQKSGRIITFSSVSGLYGASGQANYGAAKDGIAGLTRVVAKDLAKYGVTVNSISPGAATRMTDSVPDSTRALRQKGQIAPPEGILTREAEDIAPVVAWLSSDAALGVTGQVFHVAGNLVGLMSNPETVKTMNKDGRWTVDEIAAMFPATLGMELLNPKPSEQE
jgi:multifunctional beta-oxidation protein